MSTQRYALVKCLVCKKIKHGGEVTYKYKYSLGEAICDDCKNKKK